jgi:hypothetical protein
MKSTYRTKEKGWLMQIECKWCSRLSRHSLKHKLYVICDLWEEASLPSIFCDSLQGYIQMALFLEIPKKESQNWDLYYPEILDIHIFLNSSLFGTYEEIIL